MNLVERFESKIIPIPEAGCWLWGASVDRSGYGQFGMLGRCAKSHRVSYALYVGEIPAGMHVCHKCDTPSCVNPSHLFLGTDADNHSDRDRKGRVQRGSKHYRSNLTDEDIRAIRSAKEPQRVTASKFGVHQSTVSYIKTRASWAHVN